MLSQTFIEEMKQQLLEAKAKFEQDLAGLSPHTELGNGMDESAEELEIDEVNQDMIVRLNADLAKIAKALEKIEKGTYGTDDAGQEIAEARLRALPWADKAM
ncbi:MAG: hypothetical protein M1400_00780 [Patescibacteria group bacterium]|nr:hypothetical protein [Patescibacteria group bacterium]